MGRVVGPAHPGQSHCGLFFATSCSTHGGPLANTPSFVLNAASAGKDTLA
jgi:hypothetical protein